MVHLRGRALRAAACCAMGALSFTSPAAASAAGPTCTPATLDNSALGAGSVTLSPSPGSRDASPATQISFLGVPARRLRSISVVGTASGAHAGRLLAYSQGDGASFVPSRPFVQGERVTVRARVAGAHGASTLEDRFAIAQLDAITSTPKTIRGGRASEIQAFRSRPDLHPPVVAVNASSPAVAPGDLFLAPYAGPGQAGPMILDPGGGLVWFKGLPTHVSAANLQVQEYLGRPVLTWWQGLVTVHGFGLGQGVIADAAYNTVGHVRAGNGLQADLHELQLTPSGTALITAYQPILCNLAGVGGPAYGAVTDGVMQEIDIATGLVRFQWTSLAHVSLQDSYERASRTSTREPFDFFHLNSIARERDGSLLISARNTWASYDVDPRSGRILWRLGGKRSTFALGPGAATAWQHDPRQLPDGSISLFDNGASPRVHPQSRGVVIRLDAVHRKAKLVRQITRPAALLAESQGNMQALANGDWLIGWGEVPDVSEFSADGRLLFDAHLPRADESYRAFRFSWTATPVHPPAFAVQRPPGAPATVYASWNGATNVAAWRVLAGARPDALAPVAEAPRAGFETAIALPASVSAPYGTVQALDAAGAVLGTANAARLIGGAP
jgi:hypothetical protein